MAGLTLDAFHLEVQPLTEMAAVAKALRQQLTRLFRAPRFDAPLLSARNQQPGVIGLQFRLRTEVRLPLHCCYGHGALFRQITLAVHSKRECSPEQIWNATPKIHRLAASLL